MNDLVKAAPPGALATLKLFGIALSDWLVILTIIYTVFLIVDKSISLIEWWQRRKYGKGK